MNTYKETVTVQDGIRVTREDRSHGEIKISIGLDDWRYNDVVRVHQHINIADMTFKAPEISWSIYGDGSIATAKQFRAMLDEAIRQAEALEADRVASAE